jgi:hypothetical protein
MASLLQAGSTRPAPVPCSGHTAPNSALIVNGARTRAFLRPAIGELVLLADPHLVLEPHLYRCARGKLRADFRHTLGKVFLNASMASGSCR